MMAHSIEYGQQTLEFIDTVQRIERVDDVMSAMSISLGRSALPRLFVSGVPSEHSDPESMVLLNGWSRDWFRRYVSRKYYLHDPIPLRCQREVNPFAWSEVTYDRQEQPLAHKVMLEASELGMADGFCLPIHDAADQTSCVSMGGASPEISSRSKPALHLAAMFAWMKLRDLRSRSPLPKKRKLTPREREVLSWVAGGKTAWEIGIILSIAESTVVQHLTNAQLKLKARNRVHAVVCALRNGEISI
jgi:LuxR family quorum sensing-dependent transcriptional regulator